MLCHRASFKLHAWRQIKKYLTTDKEKILCSTFKNSQFNYASVVLNGGIWRKRGQAFPNFEPLKNS